MQHPRHVALISNGDQNSGELNLAEGLFECIEYSNTRYHDEFLQSF